VANKHPVQKPVASGRYLFGNGIQDFADKNKILVELCGKRSALVGNEPYLTLKPELARSWVTTLTLIDLFVHSDEYSMRHWFDRVVESLGFEVWNSVFEQKRKGLGGKNDKQADTAACKAMQDLLSTVP
jgi:hypothetical protein